MTVETKDLAKAEIEFLSDKCEKLEKENQHLRELLKKWLPLYPIYLYESEISQSRDIIELYDETANAIGEK